MEKCKSGFVFFLAVLDVALRTNALDVGLSSNLPPTCDNEIFCSGPLLHTVQMSGIYKDSKTFVDMKLKYSPDEVMSNFTKMYEATEHNPTNDQVQAFVDSNFDPPSTEFEEWVPDDWTQDPTFLKNITDSKYKTWASELNELWKHLGRKMKDDVLKNSELYSIIYAPKPVIVPGGRFREFYYWDSYWIVKGLLLSEMHTTVKGMLENFLAMVDQFGLVPNGGRIYYTRRSQPPLLIPMVKAYLEHTNDLEFLRGSLNLLEKEFHFWLDNRIVNVTVHGKTHRLARYNAESSGPRPESYKVDYEEAEKFITEEEKEEFYVNIKTGAESGWDFSSRWFLTDSGEMGTNLTDIKAREIVPVDLNAFIYSNAVTMSEFFRDLGNETKAKYYEGLAHEWMESVNSVLWDNDVGVWLDYDLRNEKLRNHFFPSNVVPLWAGCYDALQREVIVGRIVKYLKESGVTSYPGGVPASIDPTGQQWDYPNAWPPLQYFIIMGLDATGDTEAQSMAFDLAKVWVNTNFKTYTMVKPAAMFEKYDATVVGYSGGGGEYDVQLGFGWTNGVILELLDKYGSRLTTNSEPLKSVNRAAALLSAPSYIKVLTGVLSAVFFVAAGCLGAWRNRRKIYPAKLFPMVCGGYSRLDVQIVNE